MRTILKQTSWLFLAQTFGRIVGFFYTIFLARNLGVEDYGLYSVALTFFSLTSSIVDLGFNRYLTKEVALNHQRIPQLLCNIGLFRLTATAVLFSFFAFISYLLDPDKLRVSVVLLAVLAVLPQAISFTLDAIFVALQKMRFSAMALLSLTVSTTLLGVFFINIGYGLLGAVTALLLGQLVYLFILILFLRLQRLPVLASVKGEIIKKILLGSLPYGILGILGLVYFRIDILLLAYLRGNFDTGIYSVAYRFLETVVLIPNTFSVALFPVLAKLQGIDPARIRRLYLQSIKIMVMLGFLIMLIFMLLLPWVITFFLPGYIQSIDAIRILSLAIPFIFLHVSAAQVILSSEKYLKSLLLLSCLPLTVNILLNLIFIPQFGFIAAAWITVISDVFSFLLLYAFIHKYYFKDV